MNFDMLFSQQVIHRLGWWVLHFTWQGTLIAVVVSMIFFALKKANARLRYCIGCFGLILMIILPTLTVILENPQPVFNTGSSRLADTEIKINDVHDQNILTSRQYRMKAATVPFWVSAMNQFESRISLITLIWVCGVVAFSFFRVSGYIRLHFIIRSIKKPIEAVWEKRIQVWIRRMSINKKIKILQSTRISAPAVCGWLKPVLLIPVSFLTGMDQKSIESIIIHELAHIRRYDYLINIFQVMIEIVGFYHPAVWWLSNRIRKERENCCDDWAVHMLGDRLVYVKSLVRLAESRRGPHPVMAANGSELSQRIMRILNVPNVKQSSGSLFAFIFSLAFVATLLFTGFTGFRSSNQDIKKHYKQTVKYQAVYYPFSGNAEDASGTGLNCKVKGAVLCEDRFGRKDQAYYFNGKNSLIWVPGKGPLHMSESMTISCWINPERALPYESWMSMAFYGKKRSLWRAGFGSMKSREWGFTETVFKGDQKIWLDYFVTDREIPLNEWTHVTIVTNWKKGEVIMYRNGRRLGIINKLIPIDSYKTELYIGFQTDNAISFKGSIDEVRIFNTALTDEEVYAVYKIS